MTARTFHLHLSAEGDEMVVWIKAAPFKSGAVVRGPRPSLSTGLPPPPLPSERRRGGKRDFHAACESGRRNEGGRQNGWEEVGIVLFAALFRDTVREAYELALAAGRPLRLVLEFAEQEDRRGGLQGLPWECLFDPKLGRFLAATPPHSLVRFVPGAFPHDLQPLGVKLRVLAVASEAGPGSLDLDEELRRLRRSFRWKWWISLEVLRDPTPAQLFTRAGGGDFHVLHFMGHGGLRDSRGVLFLHDETGRPVAVPASAVAAGLSSPALGRPTLRLVFLNACEGARNEHVRPFSAVAMALVNHGVPAVLAMQEPIRDDDAILFGGSVYHRLVRGRPVDRAVAEARQILGFSSDRWWTPVLYSHLEDGRLFAASPARRWLQGLAAGVLATALLFSGVSLLDEPEPGRAVAAEFPRSRENDQVRLTMSAPCTFLAEQRGAVETEEGLHCWFAVDALGLLPRAVVLGAETRFVDTEGREYLVRQAWLDREEIPLDGPAAGRELPLPVLGDAELALVFDVPRVKQKAAELVVVLGDGEPLHLGDFQLDRD